MPNTWRWEPAAVTGSNMRILIPLSCLVLVLSTACAHKSSYRHDPGPSYDSAAIEAERMDPAAALPGLGAAPAAQVDYSAGVGSTMLASPAPTTASGSDSHTDTANSVDEIAPDSFETMGADSVDQMLIFTGQLAVEVEPSTTTKQIDAAVALAVTAGGYVAQMNDTTLHLRIPSKRFRTVLKQIEALGQVRSRQVQALDVSEEYNDLEVRLDNLRATRARIEKLLNQSKDLSQILIVEKELERVTLEIDRIEGRMRLLASQAAFSTIAVAFSERAPQRELKQATDEAPPSTPRTLRSSAGWVHQVGVHSLLTLD